jgi:hypothetical protein
VLDWYDGQSKSGGALTRGAVLAAIAECDRLGVDHFLKTHGFGQPRSYWIAEGG